MFWPDFGDFMYSFGLFCINLSVFHRKLRYTSKRPQNGRKCLQKWPQSAQKSPQKEKPAKHTPKMTPKCGRNGTKVIPEWTRSDPKLAPKMAPKGPQRDPEKRRTSHVKPQEEKITEKPLKSHPVHKSAAKLKIHSNHLQAYPAYSTSSWVERRNFFLPVVERNRCFTGEKGACFALFCIIFVSFRINLHIFAWLYNFPHFFALNVTILHSKWP